MERVMFVIISSLVVYDVTKLILLKALKALKALKKFKVRIEKN